MRWWMGWALVAAGCVPPGTDATDDTGDRDGTGDTQQGDRWATRAILTPTPRELDVPSCAVIDATRCDGATAQVCSPYDPAGKAFVDLDDVPLPQARAFVLGRQQDLFHTTASSGLSFETTTEMPPGTPESTWGSPEAFRHWADHGDAAYYTGYFLYGAAHRYAVTGTDADYARMVGLVDKQLVNWRVSGVPGYMIRAPFAMLDPGVSVPVGHPELPLHGHKERTNHVVYTLEGDALTHLPSSYVDDAPGPDGPLDVTPTAEGSPSLDAFSGAVLGLTHAVDLLRPEDEALRTEITEQITCHLNRYKKLRITNVQDSVGLQTALSALLGSGTFTPDPDELDLTTLDTLHGYVMEARPPDGVTNPDYRWDCPDGPPTDVDPAYDLDAASDGFVFDLLDLALRLQGQGDRPIDFVYFVDLRAGDALFMVNLALQAYHLTGDPRYVAFLEDALIDEARLVEVLPTLDAFQLPKFCDTWIGTDLLHPIVLSTLERLQDRDHAVPQAIADAMRETYRYGVLQDAGNSWFQITYGQYTDAGQDPSVDADVAAAVADLEGYVPEPDHPFDPKRATNRDWTDSGLPWIDPVTPTEAERALCEEDVELLGLSIPGPGLAAEVLNATAVPASHRTKETQIWHMNPFRLGRSFGGHLRDHEPFNDYLTPWWVAAEAGQGVDADDLVLAWRDDGSCLEEVP